MERSTAFAVLFAILFPAALVMAQDQDSVPGELPLAPPPRFTDVVPPQMTVAKNPADLTPPTVVRRVDLSKNTTLAELSNGLTIIVQENHTAPISTVSCYVRNTGSAFEGEFLGSGMSHLLETVVAGGSTSKRSERTIAQLMERMGGTIGAFTTADMTCFFVDSMVGYVPLTIDLVADMVQRTVFDQAEFDRGLKLVKKEVQDAQTNRGRVLLNMLNQTRYIESSARHPIHGYPDVLGKITRKDAVKYYQERFVPNNMVFVVVGDVLTDGVIFTVAKSFAGTVRGAETVVPLIPEPQQLTPRTTNREMPGQSFSMVWAWPTVKLSDPDQYALDLAAYILGTGESSRLVRNLVYDKKLALTTLAASETPWFVDGTFCISASCLADKKADLEKELLAQIARLAKEPVSEQELAKAKKMREARFVFGKQSIKEAANSLARNYFATGNPLYDDNYVKGIQSVKPADIQRVVQKYLAPEKLNRIVIAPPGLGERIEKEKTAKEDAEVATGKLPNGMKVLIKKQSHLPLVCVKVFVLGSSLTENEDNAGRAALLAAMLDKGTKSKTAEQIANYFDSIGGNFRIVNNRNAIIGTANVLKGDFAETAKLLGDCFREPAFPADKFERVKTIALDNISKRNDQQPSEILALFTENLPKSTPYSRFEDGTKGSVERLSLDDLKNYFKDNFVAENMLITVFGDIDPQEALNMVNEGFEKTPSSPDFKPLDLKSKEFQSGNALTESKTSSKLTDKSGGMILMGYPITSVFTEKDYSALRILSTILSDNAAEANGWLFDDLRRNDGIAYFVQTSLLTGPVPGYFLISSQTSPDKIDEVVKRIDVALDKAKRGNIPTEDFDRAKERIISRYAQTNITIADQSQQIGLDELYGLGYEYDKKFPERIQAVTLKDVVAVARFYFKNRVLVTTVPEPEVDEKEAKTDKP